MPVAPSALNAARALTARRTKLDELDHGYHDLFVGAGEDMVRCQLEWHRYRLSDSWEVLIV